MSREHSSSLARYLFVAYALLVVYASLYPFSGWRNPGLLPLAFLTAPFPRYVPSFDVAANVLGYAPLGFLAVLAAHPVLRGGLALSFGLACAFALSFALEALQFYLPSRISSNLDLLANSAGGAAGAIAGVALSRRLLRDEGLQALRYRLFATGGRSDLGLVLLALWLLAQLNPETLLFGAGDLRGLFQTPLGTHYPAEFFLRVEAAVAGANTLALGLFASCLAVRGQPARLLAAALVAAALAVRTLAFGVLSNPQDALLWVTPGAAFGVAAGMVVVIVAVALPRPAQLALAGLALMAATALVNLAPANPYMTASLALWRQGHYLNFNGLTRIVSAAWPFVAMFYLVLLAGERDRRRT